MSDRDLILGRLPESGRSELPDVYRFGECQEDNLLEKFRESFQALGGKVVTLDDLLPLSSSLWSVEPGLDLPLGFRPRKVGPWDAEFGLSRAQFAIAESGSFLLVQGGGQSRLSSLAPPVHVVLVAPKCLVWSLTEALTELPPENAVVVTGPSRTADIEGVLVRGVHGPKAVWAVFEPDTVVTEP